MAVGAAWACSPSTWRALPAALFLLLCLQSGYFLKRQVGIVFGCPELYQPLAGGRIGGESECMQLTKQVLQFRPTDLDNRVLGRCLAA